MDPTTLQAIPDVQEEVVDSAGLPEHDDSYFWKTPHASCIPHDSLNSRSDPSGQVGRRTSPRGAGGDSLSNHQKSSEMKPLDDAGMSLQAPFVELLLNKEISTKQLLEFLEEGNFPNSSRSLDERSEVSHHSERISPPKRLTSSPVSTSEASATSSKVLGSKSPKTAYMDLSKPSSTVSPKPSAAIPEELSLSMPLNPSLEIKDYKKKRLSRSCSENSLSSSSKENQKKPEKETKYSQFTTLAEIPLGMEDVARPYNLLMAVNNKRAALEQLKKDSHKKGAKEFYKSNENLEALSSRKTLEKRKYLSSQDLKMRNISEKGIQCKVDSDHYKNNHDGTQRPCSLDPSDVRSTPNERLRKPDVVLMPTRTSDPYLYGPSKSLSQEKVTTPQFPAEINTSLNQSPLKPVTDSVAPHNEDRLISGMPVNGKDRPSGDGVSIDPLNVPVDLNLFTRIQDVNLNVTSKFTDRSDNRNSFYEQSMNTAPACNLNTAPACNLNTAPACNLNTVAQDSPIDTVDNIERYFKSSVDEPTFVEEVNEKGRDSRIEKEIRKLDSFNESIASVIEKNKTVFSQNDTNVKLSNEESSVLEKTGTSSTVNNDLNFEISQSTLRGSHSSSSFDLASEDISGKSVAKFSLNMFTELLKDEDLRSAHQASIFKMKESTLTEKTKAEIAFLELEKKKLKQAGNEEGIRNIRKKIRGLIIKLEHDLEELHKARRLEKNSYRKRRQRLVDKINFIKTQLRSQSDAQNKVSKDTPNISSSGDLKKIHVTDRRGSDMRAFLERKKKELENRELALAERLAELENISSWKQRLEDGEKKIQELEARLKMSALQGNKKEGERQGLVERGTSPLRLTSDESQGERQKAEGSYSDTFDQASSSSTHDRLEGKDARKMMAIKVPLSPRVTLKRRHSSGSDESLLFSQTETQSEASDMEVRVLALQQQLKQRKAKLELLHREYKKSQRERLIAKEQSLLSQIQAYDLYIEQVRKELEKEKEGSNVKVVKPLIKQPKIVGERRKSDTWLIQDKDKHELVKNSLQSTFLVSATGGCLGSPTKEHQSSSGRRGSDFNLDTKSLERLSLKSKLPLNLNSFSDPNLLEGIDEPLVLSKVSQSSAESCESDAEKAKVQLPGGSKEGSRQYSLLSEKSKTSIIKDISHKSIPSSDNEVGTEKASNKTEDTNSISEVEKENLASYENDLDHEESEENTLTQKSIVPKASEDLVDSECSKTIEDASQKSLEEIKEDISEANDISAEASVPVTELDASLKKSKEATEGETVFISQNDHKDSDSLSQNESTSVPEAIDEKTSSSGELMKVHSTYDQNIGNAEIRDRKQALKKLRNTLLNTSIIESETQISYEDSQKRSKFNITNENDKSLLHISSNEDMETAGNDGSNEESVRELTYLEISDHAIPEDVFIDSKEVREKDAVETSSAPEVGSNGLAYSQGVEMGSSQQILKENTSQSLSEIEEHISKEDTLDDMSDGSFPLPVAKDLNSEIVGKSIEEDIPEEPESNNSKSGSEIRESVHSEVIPSEYSNQGSIVSEVNSASDHTIKESVVSEINSLQEHSNDDTNTTLNHTNKESIASEVNSKLEHSHKEPVASEVNSELEHSVKESVATEVNTELEHSIKESLLSQVNSELELSKKESVASDVKSLTLIPSNKASVVSEVNSVGVEHSNILSSQEGKESFVSEVNTVSLEKSASLVSEVAESIPTEVPSSHHVKTPKDVDEAVEFQDNSISQGSTFEEEQSSVTINESIDKSQEGSKNIEDEPVSEAVEVGRSFSENLVEDDKSPLDDLNLDDSLGEHSDLLKSFNLKSKLYGKDEEYESASDSSNSFIDEQSSEEDVYNVKTPLRQPQQMWTQENDLKGPGAPLIEALQREGGSALDVVWRGIAEAAVEEATELVISTYIKKKEQGNIGTSQKDLLQETKEVGENDEEWRREKLSQEQAEAEAEILRLQQLRIDKEIQGTESSSDDKKNEQIEALEEEEARQYFYVRAIPDKPPPPYTPRRSSLVGSVLEAAGEIWSGQGTIPGTYMPGSHLREFIWDLAGELVRRVNPPPTPALPPWVQNKRRRPKKPIRTKEQLLEEVEKEAKIYLGVEEREVRENLIIRWSKKRRDHVDEILVRESQEEEWEWTDFTMDENIIKNKIAEAVIEESISAATTALLQAFERKFGSD